MVAFQIGRAYTVAEIYQPVSSLREGYMHIHLVPGIRDYSGWIRSLFRVHTCTIGQTGERTANFNMQPVEMQ